MTAPLRFSGNRRAGEEDEFRLTSVGIDIGSSTSHLIFSLLRLERRGAQYVTVERRVLRESGILLTPFTPGAGSVIDGAALRRFVDAEYAAAGLTRADVDTGALILTGLAVRRDNAREIADLFAVEAGRFVMVTAGDGLEATMAGYGSGAVAGSAEPDGGPTLCIDLGGGTTKLAVCERGTVARVTALDVGARLVLLDEDGVVRRVEPAGRYLLDTVGLAADVGDTVTEPDLQRLVASMADAVFCAATAGDALPDTWRPLLRLPPLPARPLPARLYFSGGVSEFLSGRQGGNFGDLGALLARAVAARFGDASARPAHNVGIRATAMGASQHTMQVSGSTIFVDPPGVLPIRNLPVVAPLLGLEDEELDRSRIGAAIAADLARVDPSGGGGGAALSLRWAGSATYRRLSALCDGLVEGMASVLAAGHPLVVVSEGDVGGLIGMHLRSMDGMVNPVVSVDGIELREFDYVDVGELVPSTGAVPVVIKSLIFPPTTWGRRRDRRAHCIACSL